MFRSITVAITITVVVFCSWSVVTVIAHSGTLRISGDNSWVGFVNGEPVAEGSDWQRPTVSDFSLKDGVAVIAVYVHDAEPGASGAGGALVDVILDDGSYFASDETWKAEAGTPLAERNDGEQIAFDDSGWDNATQMAQFGAGIWGFGADTMRQTLHDPDCLAYWVWAGPNDGADDIYLRYTIGSPTAVHSRGKLTTTWANVRRLR
jgi:hypothetical protein